MAHHALPNRHRFVPETDPEEQRLLEEAMSDVKPIRSTPVAPRPNGLRRNLPNGEDETLPLREFLNGNGLFEVGFHPGYHEGGPEQRNRPLVRKLRRGGFSVQAQLDLHGMTQAEAYESLEAFLARCRRENLRCVRIVHGKGLNSTNQCGVLKRLVPQWLSTRRFARLILAFTSAPPTDGGIGATYVLLRVR